tara:strand:- start:871 stop:1386 length:516 start_codon:yes stop_codon:yes gene_type:complete
VNKKTLIVGSIIAGLGALAVYGYNMYLLTDKLCFNVTRYKIRSIAAQKVRIDLTLGVRNLGSLSIKIKKFKFNIYSGNKFLATVYSDEILDIKPATIGKTTVQLLLNPKQLLQNIGNILIDSSQSGGWKNIPLLMDGGIYMSKLGIPFYIPIKYEFKINDFEEDTETEDIC